MINSVDDFKKLITPDHRRFIEDCIKGGLADYDNISYYSPEARRDHTQSVRAAIRNCHIVARAHRAIIDMPDLRVSMKGNRVLFIVADKVRLSFKKLDKNLRSHNYPTRQALDFLNQRSDSTLFGSDTYSEITNVVAGYKHNSTETEYELFITCPSDAYNNWEWKLSGEEEINSFLSSIPSQETVEITNKIHKKRVRVRSKPIRKDTANG